MLTTYVQNEIYPSFIRVCFTSLAPSIFRFLMGLFICVSASRSRTGCVICRAQCKVKMCLKKPLRISRRKQLTVKTFKCGILRDCTHRVAWEVSSGRTPSILLGRVRCVGFYSLKKNKNHP